MFPISIFIITRSKVRSGKLTQSDVVVAGRVAEERIRTHGGVCSNDPGAG